MSGDHKSCASQKERDFSYHMAAEKEIKRVREISEFTVAVWLPKTCYSCLDDKNQSSTRTFDMNLTSAGKLY